MNGLSEGLAGQIKDTFTEQIDTFNREMHTVLRVGFAMDHEEIYHLLCENEKENYKFVV